MGSYSKHFQMKGMDSLLGNEDDSEELKNVLRERRAEKFKRELERRDKLMGVKKREQLRFMYPDERERVVAEQQRRFKEQFKNDKPKAKKPPANITKRPKVDLSNLSAEEKRERQKSQAKKWREKMKLEEMLLSDLQKRPDSNYDAKQLAEGIRVELEHTDNVKMAKKIAKDHLDEVPNYYLNEKGESRIGEMESVAMKEREELKRENPSCHLSGEWNFYIKNGSKL